MKKKPVFYYELAYVFGILALCLGNALIERADFGMSMVIAPAYLIHLKVSQFLPFYSFGMSMYVLQAVLLVLLSLVVGRFKKYYLLSFVTAFIGGNVLDGAIALVDLIPFSGFGWNVGFFVVGMLFSTFGVALLFHTYLPPEAYDLVVREISEKFGTAIGKTKSVYDLCSLTVSVVLSFVFFGFGVFMGIKWGTVICAICNGWIIGMYSRLLEKIFVFRDGLPLRDKLK